MCPGKSCSALTLALAMLVKARRRLPRVEPYILCILSRKSWPSCRIELVCLTPDVCRVCAKSVTIHGASVFWVLGETTQRARLRPRLGFVLQAIERRHFPLAVALERGSAYIRDYFENRFILNMTASIFPLTCSAVVLSLGTSACLN